MLNREKEGDLTQSYDKTPYTNRKFENNQIHFTPPHLKKFIQRKGDNGKENAEKRRHY